MDSFSLLRIASSPAWAHIFNEPEPEKSDKQVKGSKEKYLMHTAVMEHNPENNTAILCVLLLTNKKYYKLSAETLQVVWEEEILAIHAIEEDESDPIVFQIVHQLPISKNKVRSTRLDAFVNVKIFSTSTSDLRDQWVFVTRALIRTEWQQFFETLCIPSPEIYQIHFFVTKLNKKGRAQIRCIAISSERIYNIQAPEGYPIKPGKVKWAFKVQALKKLSIYSSDERSITFYTQLPKIKPEVTFIFRDEKERDLVEINRIYIKSGGEGKLNIETISTDAKLIPQNKRASLFK